MIGPKGEQAISITIVSFPVGQAFSTPLSNLVNIFCAYAGHVNVVAGCIENVDFKIEHENANLIRIMHKKASGFISSISGFALTQARLAGMMLRLAKDTDIYVFIGQGPPILNVLAAKLVGKRILWILPSSLVKTAQMQKHTMSLMLAYLLPACYSLSDRLIVYSDQLVDEWGLTPYRNKISIAYEHYVDPREFRVLTKFPDRENTIGYVGRLSAEKGVLDLLNAIPGILRDRPDTKFLLVGNGPLQEQVQRFIHDNGLEERVQLVGWVAHEDLPRYYNQMKLLVLPSYTEGLPNVLLEAMACGTPVLAAPVGAVPDIVADHVTGYNMGDHVPDHIASNILKALGDPGIGHIADDGRAFVGKNYAYEATVKKFKDVMDIVAQ